MILQKFPQLEGIELKEDKDKKELILNIKEKSPVAIWCSDKCSLVGFDGSYIKDYQNEEKYQSLPKINNETFDNSDEYRKKAVEYVSIISKSLSEIPNFKNQTYSVRAEKISAKGELPCNFIFGFYEGEGDDGEDIDWQLEKMRIAMKKEDFLNLSEVNYIDFGNKNQVIICGVEGKCSSVE
jgi:hypothetical protein